MGADVSREGVQRDLLPLIEGTTVSTKHGPVKTDHILFIASGAFHVAKPSDLLPELQGRLPIRVELQALTRDDLAPHPDRARGQPDQAVQGAAGDRGRDARVHRRRDRRDRRARRRGQQPRSRTSAPGGCRRCWRSCWRRSASPPPTAPARRWRSTPPMSDDQVGDAGAERRPEQVHPVASRAARGPRQSGAKRLGLPPQAARPGRCPLHDGPPGICRRQQGLPIGAQILAGAPRRVGPAAHEPFPEVPVERAQIDGVGDAEVQAGRVGGPLDALAGRSKIRSSSALRMARGSDGQERRGGEQNPGPGGPPAR